MSTKESTKESTKNPTNKTFREIFNKAVYEEFNEILKDAHNMLEISLDHQNELVDATFEVLDSHQKLQSEIKYWKRIIQDTEKAMEQYK